jgi:hypothetical protein
MNLQRIFLIYAILTSTLLCLLSGVYLKEAHAQAVYKHTDETGRVSYSNQPRKGAVAIDLAPLTIMQGVPVAKVDKPKAVVSNVASEPISTSSTSSTPSPSQIALPTPTFANDSQAINPAPTPTPTARVLPAPAPAQPAQISPVPSLAAAGGVSAAVMAKQRREDVKRRILEGEIEAEEQLLTEARATLAAEQARSPAMRMLRTSLPNEARPSETTIESRALIERHFARVRDLQDHVTMHEQNLSELREMLTGVASAIQTAAPRLHTKPSAPAASVNKQATTNTAKVAIVSATPTPKSQREVKPVAASAPAPVAPPAPTLATIPKASISASPPLTEDQDSRAVSQLPVVKLRPASNSVSANLATSLPKRSMAEDR